MKLRRRSLWLLTLAPWLIGCGPASVQATLVEDRADDPLLVAFQAQHWTFRVSAPRGTKAQMFLALREPGKPERLLESSSTEGDVVVGVIPIDGSGFTTAQRLRLVTVSEGRTGRSYLANPLKGAAGYRVATAGTPPRSDGAYVLLESEASALVCFFREDGWLQRAHRDGRVRSTRDGVVAAGDGW